MNLFSCIFAKSKTKHPAPVKSESRNPSSSWSDLPPDLVRSIIELLDVSSSVRLSAVCTSWSHTIHLYLRSFAPFNLNQPIPLLLRSAQNSKINPNCTDFTFYDLTTSSSYSIPISIPSLHDHQWLGCDKSWLVTLDPQSQIHLIKPHTGAHLLLPSMGKGKVNCPRKVILARTPDCTDGCVAFCITKFQQGLFFLSPGAKSWAYLFQPVLDVALHRGEIYVVSPFNLHLFGFQGSSVTLKRSFYLPNGFYEHNLSVWRGALLVLCTNHKPQYTLWCHKYILAKLYKFEERDHKNRWTCVTSLGGDALFVGDNHTYAVSTSDIDSVHRNCIYFTDHLLSLMIVSPSESIQFKCYFDLLMKAFYFKPCSPPDSHTQKHPPIWFRPC